MKIPYFSIILGDNSDLYMGENTVSTTEYADFIDQQHSSNFGPLYRRHGSKHLNHDDKEDLRLKINGRERERMHDLNSAMDALRQVSSKSPHSFR